MLTTTELGLAQHLSESPFKDRSQLVAVEESFRFGPPFGVLRRTSPCRGKGSTKGRLSEGQSTEEDGILLRESFQEAYIYSM